MPTYDYFCEKCENPYSFIKSIKEYSARDLCPNCKVQGYRIYSCKTQFIGTKIEDAEYNYGLGTVTKSKNHRNELAKRMNVVEIGNEKPSTIHSHFDKAREEKRRQNWDDI